MKKKIDVEFERLKDLFSQPHAENVELEYYHKVLRIEEPYEEFVKYCLNSTDIIMGFIYQTDDGRYFLAFRMFMDYCDSDNKWYR